MRRLLNLKCVLFLAFYVFVEPEKSNSNKRKTLKPQCKNINCEICQRSCAVVGSAILKTSSFVGLVWKTRRPVSSCYVTIVGVSQAIREQKYYHSEG